MKLLKRLTTAAAVAGLMVAGLVATPAQAAMPYISSVEGLHRIPVPANGVNSTAQRIQTSYNGAGNVTVLHKGENVVFNLGNVGTGRQIPLYSNGGATRTMLYVGYTYGGVGEAVPVNVDSLRLTQGWNDVYLLDPLGSGAKAQFKVFYIASSPTVYDSPGELSYAGNYWRTSCQKYSATVRCATEFSRTYSGTNTKWTHNNLSYLAGMTRAQWGNNPLARTGTWNSGGYYWKTECDTVLTGRNGCRTWIRLSTGWAFNSKVAFKTA